MNFLDFFLNCENVKALKPRISTEPSIYPVLLFTYKMILRGFFFVEKMSVAQRFSTIVDGDRISAAKMFSFT